MRIGWIAALPALMLLTAGPAAAQTADPVVVTNPSWASIPSGADMSEVYPGFAIAAGLDGDVTLRCVARADGVLDLCEVMNATPSGLGFDRAGLSLSRLFRTHPLRVGGTEAKSTVQFTIRFRPAPYEAAPPWTGPEPDAGHLQAVRAMIEAMRPAAEREFEQALDDLDVDPDRAATARAIVQQTRSEFDAREREAAALAMARLLTPEQFATMTSGRGMPPTPSDDLFARAGGEVTAVMEEKVQRIKALYCARYDCPVLTPAP